MTPETHSETGDIARNDGEMANITLPPGCMGIHPADVVGPTGFGCDIRPGSWDLVIGECVLAPGGFTVIRPVFVGKVRDEHDVLFLARQYRCRVGVCDTRPETTLAKRLQIAAEKYGIKVWRAEYNTAPSTIEVQPNESERLLKLDRTMNIDNVHYAFTTGLTVQIPQNYKEILGGDFAREMCNMTRVPTRWMGRDCYTWEKQGPDHQLHAFTLLFVGVKVGNLIASGFAETMGATRGMVASTLERNTFARREIRWDDEEESDDGGVYLEM